MKEFLAKSNPIETVQYHTDQLLKNLEHLKKTYPNLKINWDILFYACLYHDIGKINNKFQEKLLTKKKIENEIPHGLLSICCLNLDELEAKFTEKEIKILIYSIAYHHERDFEKLYYMIEENLEVEIEKLNKILPKFKYDKLKIESAGDVSEYFYSDRIYPPTNLKTKQDEEQQQLFFDYILIKGLLNRIDYAASAGINVELENDFLEEKLEKMLEKWQKKNPLSNWNVLQKFAIENREKNIIAVAQTGMGKTEAGLLWIGNNKGFFILPLKTAINSIYDRVTKEIVDDKEFINKIGLLHSDTLEKYFTFSETEKLYEEIDIDSYYTSTKQFSLPLTICTLDQIFDFVYRYRGFEPKLATLSYSKIVLDEIQMYSPDLLAYVIRGLADIEKIGGKFAILTATLPQIIIDLLKEEGVSFEISKDFTKEDLPVRHSVKVLESAIDTDKIIAEYNKNKILVICNTVKEAQRVAKELREKLKEDQRINVFHSKFIKQDRKEKEKAILELGNKKSTDYGIWIATQVVEASLDIDFDILFTELSDLNGLFQRMGRCYRNRPWNKEGYNCYVFIEKENKKNTGIGRENGIIDIDIYTLSKEVIKKNFEGIITETEKMNYIKELYTTENLKNTTYYNKIKETLNYLKLIYPYSKDKEEVKKKFRDITSYTIIPKNIYEVNKKKIEENLEILQRKNEKEASEVERKKLYQKKIEAKRIISEFTMSILGYEIITTGGKNFLYTLPKIEIGRGQNIFILDCYYDNDFGFKIKKNSVSEKLIEESNTF